jgi:hypothetical protein
MRSRILAVVFLSAFVIGTTFFIAPVRSLSLLWEDQVPSLGLEVTSSVLISGEQYTIVVSDRWWYSKPSEDNLAADAMYYTTNYTDSWDWVDNFAAPGGHSFLQIDGQDVDWGPFSNGDTNHTYSINYTGQDAALVFRTIDWVDGNYTNNECKLLVRIYGEHTVGGTIIDADLFGTSLYVVSIFAVILSVTFVTVFCDKLIARRVQRALFLAKWSTGTSSESENRFHK